MKRIHWLTVLSLVTIVVVVLPGVLERGLWNTFLGVAAAILVLGLLNKFENDLPGGFNNLDGLHTPKYATVIVWGIRGIEIALVLLCVLALGLHFFS